MTNQPDPAAQLVDITKQLADSQAALAISKALGEMSDPEKALYKGMDAAGQEAFRKLTPEQRVEKVRASQDSNAVIYTSLDGETFRKNDDPRLVAMAKRADDDRRTLATERAGRRIDELKKRAESELKNFPKEPAVKAALLGAVDSIGDEATRNSVREMLKAGNDALAKSFKQLGTTESGPEVDSAETAHEKLESIGKGLREKDSKLDYYSAYQKACEQNPELHEQAVGSTVGEER